MEWSSTDFGNIVGKSRMQINRYRKEGMPSIQKGKNYYFNYDSIRWLFNTGVEQIERTDESDDVESLPARERKDLADAKNKEFDLAVKQGKFIPNDVARANGANAGVFVRETISSMPDRLIPRLEIDDIEIKHYLRLELKKEIYESLLKISNFAKG
ncbi:hypothetical protein MNB_SV-14-1018 [hydrothermal vent metagenome]|uniref:Uncharacterized protein n=1 Tax=hydrothermal vent metagenome TaxID=652676 RepID=A0A1W1CCQ2_9ZZZZ